MKFALANKKFIKMSMIFLKIKTEKSIKSKKIYNHLRRARLRLRLNTCIRLNIIIRPLCFIAENNIWIVFFLHIFNHFVDNSTNKKEYISKGK